MGMQGSGLSELPARTTVVESGGIRLHLFQPAEVLRPYVTVYYRTETAGGEPVEDWLPPEWANLRIGAGDIYQASIGDGPLVTPPRALISGPTSRVTRLRIAGHDAWGIGLLPLGFARFTGFDASAHANRFDDLSLFPGLATLRNLLEEVFSHSDDLTGNVERLDTSLLAMIGEPAPREASIVRVHEAIVADSSRSVAEMAELAGMNQRTFGRFCQRRFGFSPKLLLRRQRFLRSLANFMIDPSMKWVESLDHQYFDQAHFLRDFRYFMAMRPNEYAALPHPIAMTAARARREALGAPMQVLHLPQRS